MVNSFDKHLIVKPVIVVDSLQCALIVHHNIMFTYRNSFHIRQPCPFFTQTTKWCHIPRGHLDSGIREARWWCGKGHKIFPTHEGQCKRIRGTKNVRFCTKASNCPAVWIGNTTLLPNNLGWLEQKSEGQLICFNHAIFTSMKSAREKQPNKQRASRISRPKKEHNKDNTIRSLKPKNLAKIKQ